MIARTFTAVKPAPPAFNHPSALSVRACGRAVAGLRAFCDRPAGVDAGLEPDALKRGLLLGVLNNALYL